MIHKSIIPIYFIKKAYITIGFFCSFYVTLYSQDQKLSDSLEIIYNRGDFDQEDELKILRELAETETNAEKIIVHSLRLIVLAKTLDSAKYEYSGYLQKGNAYRLKGDLTKALESYIDASKVASKAKLPYEEATVNINIADTYSVMGDSDTSFKYYREGLKLLEKADFDDPLDLAYAQLNFGDEYLIHKELDSALYYFNQAGKTFDQENDELGKAYFLGNVGLVYAEKGMQNKAEVNLNEAIILLTKIGDYYAICVYLNAISDIFQEKEEYNKALEYALRSLKLAQKYRLKEQISESNFKLSEFYEKKGDINKAYSHYKDYIIYKDSVKDLNDVQKMASDTVEFEVSKKQIEVDLLNEKRRTQNIIVIFIVIGLILIGLLAFSLFKRNKYMKKVNGIIEYEKHLSDDLLKNILPEETALELKEKGEVAAKKFDSVSVLFTDFEGFTKLAESLTPEILVESIDYYFSKFDNIIEKHGLEKIKTVGDAYMCAGGLPFPSDNHALKTSLAALEIVEFVKRTKENPNHKLAKFEIRVGINTGPVVAGVVGNKKFQYDIWGDTVNVASRMESSGVVGRVNISESTYGLLTNYHEFEFESRGFIEAKGKGEIQMYFLNISTNKQSIYV